MSKIAKSRLNSTWTPLNNEEINQKIYNERRALIIKWYEKWNDSQRLIVLEELVGRCSGRQLELASTLVSRRKPVLPDDFTRCFPRILSLYLFSFLDPRSLCRCAQVSWHWKALVEVDQLWIPKCLRLGWILGFSPSLHEAGMWKRLYIENIVTLKNSLLDSSKTINLKQLERAAAASDTRSIPGSARMTSAFSSVGRRPPWKGSDPAPKDTWRNNYLDNDDEIEKVNKLRRRGVYGPEADDVQRRARNKVNTGRSMLKRSNSLTRPPSAVPPTTASVTFAERPTWAMSPDVAQSGFVK